LIPLALQIVAAVVAAVDRRARDMAVAAGKASRDFFAVVDAFRMDAGRVEPATTGKVVARRHLDDDDDDDDGGGACFRGDGECFRGDEDIEDAFETTYDALRAWRARNASTSDVDAFHAFVVSLRTRPQARWQCLVAALMSVQCLDKVALRAFQTLRDSTPDREVTLEAIAAMSTRELEQRLSTLNLFRVKAKYIRACADVVRHKFRGEVPRTVGALKTLPGVGDKLAHLVASVSYGGDEDGFAGIVVDTHVKRVAKRLGWAQPGDDAESVRMSVQARVKREEWEAATLGLIALGQRFCHAKAPSCATCPVTARCPSARTYIDTRIGECLKDGEPL
jgi:endonuclease-3